MSRLRKCVSLLLSGSRLPREPAPLTLCLQQRSCSNTKQNYDDSVPKTQTKAKTSRLASPRETASRYRLPRPPRIRRRTRSLNHPRKSSRPRAASHPLPHSSPTAVPAQRPPSRSRSHNHRHRRERNNASWFRSLNPRLRSHSRAPTLQHHAPPLKKPSSFRMR